MVSPSHRVPRAPARLRRWSGALRGRRRWRGATAAPRRPTGSCCASANGMRPVPCDTPSRWRSNGRPGSTTSASPRTMSRSSSRPPHVVRAGGHSQRRALRVGARREGGSAWCPGRRRLAVRWIRLDPCLVTHVLGAYDQPAWGHRPLRVPLRRARAGSTRRSLGLRGRSGRPRADADRRDPGRAGALADRRRTFGAHAVRRPLRGVSTAGPVCEGAPFRFGYSAGDGMAPADEARAAMPPRPPRSAS